MKSRSLRKDIDVASVDSEVKRTSPSSAICPVFAPGKVPANLVRKMHGESIDSGCAECSAIQESVRQGDRATTNSVPPFSHPIESKDGKNIEAKFGKDVDVENGRWKSCPIIPTPSCRRIEAGTPARLKPGQDKSIDEALARNLPRGQKQFETLLPKLTRPN
jgi:trigger factor